MTLTAFLIRLARDRKAATAVEYGFILAMIALAIMAGLLALGTTTSTMWNNVSSKVAAVTPT
jgi:pilus assembly protein Flp/PilA